MSFFYRIFYAAPINFIVRNFLKFLNSILGTKLRTSISGTVTINIDASHSIKLHTNESCHVTHSLFYDGAMKYEFTDVFLELIKDTKCFLDIGSNIGYFSLVANSLNPKIKIFAFEPGKGPSYFLKKNLEINKCKDSHAVIEAMSDHVGKVNFHEIRNDKFPYLEHYLSGASSTVNKYDHLPTSTYEVVCNTLDNFVIEKKLESIDLIKLDTEFNEHLVLSQAKNALRKFQPIIISEVFPVVAEEVEKHLKELGYIIHQYKDGKLHHINSFSEVSESIERNFFLAPPEKLKVLEKFMAQNG